MSAVAIILAVAFLAALGWGAYWRWQAEEPQDETWAARFETEVWKKKATSLETDLTSAYESLNSVLDEHALCPVPTRPVLSVVRQRDDEHDRLPVADGHFPVHTAVDDDELTALIRATEERS